MVYKNKEDKREYDRLYYIANKERILEEKFNRRKEDPEKYRKIGKEQYNKHRVAQKIRDKIRYDENPEKYRARQRAYYAKNKERINLKRKKLYHTNKLKI